MNIDTFIRELMLSHVLVFGRSPLTTEEMDKEFPGIQMSIVDDYRDQWSGGIETVQISDFPIYGTRLQAIQQRMTEWRALSFAGLFKKHYRDLTAYYAFILAMIFGSLSVLGLLWSVFAHLASWCSFSKSWPPSCVPH
jgi:hypothetical protein